MDPVRIVELLTPFLESQEDCDRARDLAPRISTYIDILLHWNGRMNLTAIRDPEQIVTRHFGESLFAARHLFAATRLDAAPIKDSGLVQTSSGAADATAKRHIAAHGVSRGASLADLGSGAGFPGIPIKLWAPEVAVTLIESNQKKAVFLREVTRALTLTDIDIQNLRAETLPQAFFDIVTLRAVERFERALPTAAALVAPRGRLVLLIGASQLPDTKSILEEFEAVASLSVPNSTNRILCVARRRNPVG